MLAPEGEFPHSLTYLRPAVSITTRRGRLGFVLLLFFLVLLTTYPRYLEILLDPSPALTYRYFFDKIAHPLTPTRAAADTHASKVDFRLTVPLLAGLLHPGKGQGIIVLYLLQSALLIPFLYILLRIFQRFLNDGSTMLLTLSFASIYVSKAFFWDYDFWFDGYAYFFLLAGMFIQNRLGIFCVLTLACWTDERAVVALYSVYLFHLLQENNFKLSGLDKIFNRRALSKKSTLVLFAGLVYFTTRLWLSYHFGLHTPYGHDTGVGFGLIPYQLKYRLVGVFLAFEGMWLPILATLFLLTKNHQYVFLLSHLLLALAIHILVAYAVFDITRSLAYSLPLLIIFGIIAGKYMARSYTYLFLAAALCVLIPTQYLIYFPRQIPWTVFSFSEIKSVFTTL